MKAIGRGLIGVFVLGLLTSGAQAKKPDSKQKPHLIYYDQFQKLTDPKKEAYIEALRDAMDKMQEKSPSFVQYLFDLLNEPSYAYDKNDVSWCGWDKGDWDPTVQHTAAATWIRPGCENMFNAAAAQYGLTNCQVTASGNDMNCTAKTGQTLSYHLAGNTDVNVLKQGNSYAKTATTARSDDGGSGGRLNGGGKATTNAATPTDGNTDGKSGTENAKAATNGNTDGKTGVTSNTTAAAAVTPPATNTTTNSPTNSTANTFKPQDKDFTDGQSIAVRCTYAGFMIAAVSGTGSKNSCSPVTNLCDGKSTRAVPPVSDLASLICTPDKSAGSCQGGSVQKGAAKSEVVCDPLLYGLDKNNHVICVNPGTNASKDCHTNAGTIDSINALLKKGCDSTASVPSPVTTTTTDAAANKSPSSSNNLVGNALNGLGGLVSNFFKPAVKPGSSATASPNTFVGAKDVHKLVGALDSRCTGFDDDKKWEIIQRRAGQIKSTADFQSTCASLIAQVKSIAGNSNADQVIKDGASQLGNQ